MSVKINVWYPKGSNVGHASINLHGTYVSWWPDASDPAKTAALKTVFFGGQAQAPTYDQDKSMEGGEPSWTGDFFGWDNDNAAVALWNKIYLSDFLKGISGAKAGAAQQQYSFVSNNCCDVVDKMLETAGAYDYQFKLNLWRGLKTKLAPKDIATIGCYLAGQTGVLDWDPFPQMF